MVYLTALVPMKQGVQAYAQLKAHADAVRGAGDGRSGGQIMADTLIERITGRGKAEQVPVTVNLLVSDETLLAGGQTPGVLLEGSAAGVGTVPAQVARELVAAGMEADAAWMRAIYADPQGRLLATTSAGRFFPDGIMSLLRARQQGICATPYCDAPIRHADHVVPHGAGGATSLANGQGLCVRCNHAKQAPGWSQTVLRADDPEAHGRHAVATVTPTGHRYLSAVPEPPHPARGRLAARDRPPGADRESQSCASPPGAIARPRRGLRRRRADRVLDGEHAELVPLGVRHDHPVLVPADLARARGDESCDLGLLVEGAHVEMHPVLHRLGLGHAVEEEPRPDAAGRLDQDGGVVLRVVDAEGAQPRQLLVVVGRYGMVVQHCGPEPSQRGRVTAVEDDVAKRRHAPTR